MIYAFSFSPYSQLFHIVFSFSVSVQFLFLLLFTLLFFLSFSFSVLSWFFLLFPTYGFFSIVAHSAKSKNHINENLTSKEPSIRFKNGIPLHSNVDLSASCPRCLAAAAEKPGGSDGELLF